MQPSCLSLLGLKMLHLPQIFFFGKKCQCLLGILYPLNVSITTNVQVYWKHLPPDQTSLLISTPYKDTLTWKFLKVLFFSISQFTLHCMFFLLHRIPSLPFSYDHLSKLSSSITYSVSFPCRIDLSTLPFTPVIFASQYICISDLYLHNYFRLIY